MIIVNGGVGDGGNFGGGLGGCIVIYLLIENKYFGDYIVIGGRLGDVFKDVILYVGGFGIVYFKDLWN